MYDNFGKKLEDARTRQGISIRQAADTLKIRAEFLTSFESDHGNFDMPEVYKRGFLKSYANLLKIDSEDIIRDYDSYHKGSRKPKAPTPTEQTREVLGRIDLPASKETPSPESQQPSLPFGNDPTAPKKPKQQPQTTQTFNTSQTPKSSTPTGFPDSRSLYLKLGLIFGGTLAVFTILALIISKSFNSDSPELNAELVAASDTIDDSLFDAQPAQLTENITLTADEQVHVVVRQESDKKRLFGDYVEKGHPITLSRNGPVKIHFSDGSHLMIEKSDGKKVRPGRKGVGWIEL